MTRSRLLRLLVAGFVLIAGGVVAAAPRPSRGWVDHAPMSSARTESAYASTGEHIYVMGGFGIQLVNVPTVEVYDVVADTWSDGPPMPLALNHAMGAAHAGVVYVFGGYLAVVFGATNTSLALKGGAWQTVAPMPETRAGASAVAVGGKIFVVGGFSQQGTLADKTLVYDIAADRWSIAPSVPTKREHLTAVAHGPFIYAIGGRTGSPSTNMTVVERLDTRTGVWRKLAPMKHKRSGHASAITTGGQVVALGGEGLGEIFDTAEVYDVRRNRWSSLPALTSRRTGLGAAAVGNRVFTFFGAGDQGYLDVTQSIDLR